jgi:hypothetical protein
MHMTISTPGGARLTEGEGTEFTETAERLYNGWRRKAYGQRTKRHIALSEHFPGGSTWHCQFGYAVGNGRGTTLDDMVVIHWTEN